MQNHFLTQIEFPPKELRTLTDVITVHRMEDTGRLECDPLHPGGAVFRAMNLCEGQRALILSLKLTYSANSTGRDIFFEFRDLFVPRTGKSQHPDVTGIVKLVIPANHQGSVPKARQTLYEPNFVNLGVKIIPYAGMEEAMRAARSTAVLYEGDITSLSNESATDFQLFKVSDPLLVFMLQHVNVWSTDEIGPHDICAIKHHHIYKVRRRAVERAQSVFKNAIFPLFCYTHPMHKMHIVEERPREEQVTGGDFALAVFVLELEYMVVGAMTPMPVINSNKLFI